MEDPIYARGHFVLIFTGRMCGELYSIFEENMLSLEISSMKMNLHPESLVRLNWYTSTIFYATLRSFLKMLNIFLTKHPILRQFLTFKVFFIISSQKTK